ncbi:MAG: selenide, water dikinase SelD [Bacteroidales bacterium]|nr:selenide, water dikinase SelD [Bacteroidales bacterium]
MHEIRLTQYSHGSGCGCKISPGVLREILHNSVIPANDPRLLVGNESLDDAAVYDMGDGTAILSTTDFFMPVVDDPFVFGKIAAINAISDIYAMGGKPFLAIAVLGWPVNKLSSEIAREVVDGGREACKEAGIILAGGHSIDNQEPIFGLAVTGRVRIDQIKRNNTATAGSKLYLTKPLGVGILTTALKLGRLRDKHKHIAAGSMLKLNAIGQDIAEIEGITAMTDVTGFGLLGHLTEVCEGSNLSAVIEFDKIPILAVAGEYIAQNCIPGGTYRNWESYRQIVYLREENDKFILCDPQTSGGLLIAVEEHAVAQTEHLLKTNNIEAVSFGYLTSRTEVLITVI